ncbi:MAG: ABC transporter ATP-binding protein [Eubacterium sp.]|nr:ABC transporter ATP-binding protein [Eubacterium sp.]
MTQSHNKKLKISDWYVIKWLLTICKQQIPTMVIIVILNVIVGFMSVFFANFSKKIIDAATVTKSFEEVIKFTVIFFGIVIIQMLLTILKNCLSERSHGRLDIILKSYLFDTIVKKEYSKTSSYHTGDLQNRLFNDVQVVSDGLVNIVPQALYFFSRLASSLIYLIILDKLFALIFLVGGCFVFLLTQTFRKTLKRLHLRVQETEGKTRSFIQESLINLLVIKAFSVEDKIEEHSNELQEDNFKARIKRRNFSIIANTGLSAVFNIGSVFAVAFGAWGILFKDLTYGTVTALIQLVNQVQSPFASLSGIMPKYFSLIASAERLIEIDNLPDEVGVNEKEFEPDTLYDSLKSIEFDKITFKYDRDVILDNTSLTVDKGDFVAIMGISGIGKSTLLKLLLGVFSVQDGSIYLNTDSGRVYVDKYTRKMFSYVPQGNMLISGTIRDNLTFINSSATEDEIQEAVRISCADQFINELPDGIDTVIGEKGLGLSEGQIQRLAIARSLLSKAPVLLLDEATSALDEETEKKFLTNLKSLNNVSCIIVSHKKAALEICNKRIQIIEGKIVEG